MALIFMGSNKPFALIDTVWRKEDEGEEAVVGNA